MSEIRNELSRDPDAEEPMDYTPIGTVAGSERDRYIRAFNRLEKAVTNHITNRCLDGDDLAHVHKTVMRDLQERSR